MHDLLDAYPPLLYIMFLVYYCSLNDTGILYITLTGLPFCFRESNLACFLPLFLLQSREKGLFHNYFRIRYFAVFLNNESYHNSTLNSISCATTGYFTFWLSHDDSAEGPPGKFGICSTTSYTFPFICFMFVLFDLPAPTIFNVGVAEGLSF